MGGLWSVVGVRLIGSDNELNLIFTFSPWHRTGLAANQKLETRSHTNGIKHNDLSKLSLPMSCVSSWHPFTNRT